LRATFFSRSVNTRLARSDIVLVAVTGGGDNRRLEGVDREMRRDMILDVLERIVYLIYSPMFEKEKWGTGRVLEERKSLGGEIFGEEPLEEI
jgi:hypothetical protein